ncbi:zinc ABC transporter substrate-binding protein [Nocardioides dongxiaopingii]|uniref:metal ABC transporter substrate-binding protein n=1 Tax=Nocardioides sp. S-1144 TaxID=2582905 RepID=UPI00110EEA21|nr:metal ABC transporter substrate-binding protein [Nocardioides sp. S-1144]QCW50858.1 zinc ABC transporter substrate-binding protein [Nocardioides sp. S-1144]
MRRLLLPCALLLAATGCSALADDGAGDGGTPSVVTAFYPLQYVADRVAGEHADVENLTTAGKEPHDLETTVKETAMIAEAALVVHEKDFQPAVDDAVAQNATGEVLDAAEVVGLQPFSEEGHEEEGHEEHADEEGHTEDDGHDHEGGLDPHFWLDPTRMADLGDAVADALADIDPDHADDFAANAAALRTDLEEVDRAYTDGLATCERSTIVVSHDAFGYLGKYGVDVAPVAGLSPDAEPTPAVLAQLQELIDEDGVTTVFNERLASPRFVESLANDTGVETAVLDPIEGLTDETSDDDYLSLMTSNLAALREANACR